MKMRVVRPEAALAVSETRPVNDKNPPVTPIAATREISRPPVMRAAIPIGDFYCGAFPGSPRTTTRDARRRTGGELDAANIGARSRGRPLDWLRVLQIT